MVAEDGFRPVLLFIFGLMLHMTVPLYACVPSSCKTTMAETLQTKSPHKWPCLN